MADREDILANFQVMMKKLCETKKNNEIDFPRSYSKSQRLKISKWR
jgi:hypothetical protein